MGTTDTGLVPIVTGGGPTVNFSAEAIRYLAFSSWGEGVIESDRVDVAEAGTPNMTVDVTLSDDVVAVIEGDDADGQGRYVVKGDGSTYSVAVTAADATNPRVDLLILEVKDTQYDASGQRTVQLRTIDGTPTAGATLANRNGAQSLSALPDSCIPLRDILVPAADTTIEDAQLQDEAFLAYQPGRVVGYGEITTTASSAGDAIGPVTFIGDGVHEYDVFWGSRSFSTSGVAGTTVDVEVFSGASGTGTNYGETLQSSGGANYACNPTGSYRGMSAFTGRRSLYLNLSTSSGTPALQADATYPAYLEIRCR